jgi:uncharacterized membrane protein YGL010W
MGNGESFVRIACPYKSYHLNRTNLNLHFLCVPFIMWSLALLLSMKEFKIGEYLVNVEQIIVFGIAIPYWFILDW